MITMKQVRTLLLVGGLLLLMPVRLRALAPEVSVVIAELQTGSLTSASEEFIELHNISETDVDISTWRVEYFSASATSLSVPSRTIPLHGTLAAGKSYLLASNDYLTDIADESYSATLAKSGGHVRLVSPDAAVPDQVTVHDLVGWGTAAHPEGTAAPAPAEGSSLERKLDENDEYVDTDNNAEDFAINTTPTPVSTNPAPAEPEPDVTDTTPIDEQPDPVTQPADDTTEVEETPVTTTTTTLLPLQISELLPNPAPPDSDSTDEYVELYNPNPEPIDLTGYKLQTGNSYSYSFSFDDEEIAAHSYRAWYVADTDLLLANSGGQARLINPSGQVIAETTAYEGADDGQAWALINGTWQWTLTPTPAATNKLTVPLIKPSTAKTASATKKTTTKKSTSKVAASKKSTKKPTTTTAKSASDNAATEPIQLTSVAPVHPAIIGGVGALALLYAGNEYRQDFSNRLYQLRRYREARRAARAATQGG